MPVYYVSRVGSGIPPLHQKGEILQYDCKFILQTYDKISFLRMLQDCRELF